MKLRGHPHRGALLFTLVVGVILLSQVAGLLSRPLSISTPSLASSEEPETAVPVSDRTPLPAELHSEWYTQSESPTVTTGETVDVTILFRNVGHTAWISGSPSEIRLGEVGPRPLPPEMRVGWFAWDRPARQSELIVHPQQLATFSFKVAGTTPGVYRLNVRPVVDGVAWLKDEGVFVDITVE